MNANEKFMGVKAVITGEFIFNQWSQLPLKARKISELQNTKGKQESAV